MADVTIKQLATVLGVPADKLIEQCGEAGMQFAGPEQVISNEQKQQLLGFLRENHGKVGAVAVSKGTAPRKITLKRRRVSELKVSTGSGRRVSSKTVNVEVRAKRTYVKRSEVPSDTEALSEREDALRKLKQSQEQQEREQQERDERAQRRVAVAAEAEAAATAKQAEAAAAVASAAAAEAAEPAASVADQPESTPQAEDPTAEPASEPETSATSTDTADGAGAAKSAWDTPVMPQLAERRKRREKPAATKDAQPAAPAKTDATPVKAKVHEHTRGRGRDDDGDSKRHGKKRLGAGKLHLSEGDRERRSTHGPRRHGKADFAHGALASGQHGFSKPTAPVVREVPVGDTNLISELAQKMAVKGAEVVKALFKMGVMVTINETVDHDTAVLVVEELGHTVVEAEIKNAEATLLERVASAAESGEKVARPPVVTIMGHVDHGKTSLLDHIRRTKIAAGEAGGITQHIGAYRVTTPKGTITFLDTPGHAAFTAMRARGARSTDIVVLVVAADDGVMPQTLEAIDHARAAKVPLIVAVNKIDKPGANVDNVKQELANHEVIPEDWGGDVQCVPVSAKTGAGVDDLLVAISLQAELLELKAVAEGRAAGTVIEARLERGRGPVATVLVQRGCLSKGDYAVCGVEYGRMRALVDENGKQVQSATPSVPVQVLGLSGVPAAGDDFTVVPDEKLAKQVADEREQQRRETRLVGKSNRLEDIMAQMGKTETQQVLNILVKADVQGSAGALRDALGQIGNESVKVNVIAAGVGGITESDATLAAASKALLIGFNVRADAAARKVVETSGTDLRYFSIIYDVIDQVTQAATGLLGKEVREEIIGTALVREVFRSSRFGAVAGCMIEEGTVRHNKPIRVLRDHVVVFEGELESLRRFKDNVEEVHAGTECGIAVKQYNDVQPGDQIECFERTEVARTL